MTLKIYPAKTGDSHDVWVWRNDVQTRENSQCSDKITWNDHDKWFKNSLKNKNTIMLLSINDEDLKIGVCRFDLDIHRKYATVSINLNPEMRGKGYSSDMLLKSIKYLWEILPVDIKAKIKVKNTASIKCFESCGFSLINRDEAYLYYVKVNANK